MSEKKHQAEIVYESKGKTPMGDPFLTVKKARGYYEYAERGGVDSIAFILFDSKELKMALIKEGKPPLDERFNEVVMKITAFGGSIDVPGSSYQEICQKEVLEESGYDVPLDRIYSVGKTMVSTQMSQLCEGFFVDVTGLEKTHKTESEEKDASDELAKNKTIWMSTKEVLENNDWKSIWILSRALFLGHIK